MDDRIQVPLDLKDFEVLGSEILNGTLEVELRSTRRPACHHCGSLDVSMHAVNERRVRDRACGYPTVLRWHQRRFRCNDCSKTAREAHPEIAGRKSVTHRYRRRLFERACNEPHTDVARSEAVSAYRVEEAFEHHAATELVARDFEPPRVVAIDESAFKKRFHFHTVFSDPERGIVFDLVEGRHKGAVFEGLLRLDDQVRAGIETVVMDCYWRYRRAIEEMLPDVRIVADKFHVVRAIDGAAQKVRMRFGRRAHHRRVGRDGGLARQDHPASDPHIFHVRWVFMKRAPKLSATESEWLQSVFDRAAPEIRLAWLLKEQFAAIYDAPDRAEAERRLEVWVDHIIAAGLPEFINVWRSMQSWIEPILAYFDDPVTNAFAEGISNKIKVMKRRSYGFRDPMRYRQKVLLSCRRRPGQRG